MSQDLTNPVQPQGTGLAALSLIAWIIPIAGFPISVVALIQSVKTNNTTGVVMATIGLLFSVVNSVIGAINASSGGF